MEHATLENVGIEGPQLSAEALGRLSEYLTAFISPVKSDRPSIDCPCCGAMIYSGGGPLDALLSSFEWGLAHGDGFCGRCKWPIRMYHFIQLDKPEKTRLVYPLAYRCYTDDTHTVEIDPAAQKDERLSA